MGDPPPEPGDPRLSTFGLVAMIICYFFFLWGIAS